MITAIKNFFGGKKSEAVEYTGLADFFLHASSNEKKKVITEAARKANDDQLKVFNEALLKTRTN